MSLSKEAIEEFKEIYRQEFGEEISDQTALELTLNLLNLFRVIYKPITKKEFEEFKNPKFLQDLNSEV